MLHKMHTRSLGEASDQQTLSAGSDCLPEHIWLLDLFVLPAALHCHCHLGDPVRGGAAPRFADLCTARRRTSDLKHRVPEVDGRPHGCGTLKGGKVRLAGAFSLAGLWT